MQINLACWADPAMGHVVEFRTNAQINAISRGKIQGDKYSYFNLCPRVSCRANSKTNLVPVFEDKWSNRHDFACSYRNKSVGQELKEAGSL